MAGKLHVGEPVQEADGRVAIVEALRVVPGAASMWDLTVSNVHTFAVGNVQAVVHNCGLNGKADPAKKIAGQNNLYEGQERENLKRQGFTKVKDAPGNPVNSGDFRRFIEAQNPGYTFNDLDWSYHVEEWQRGNTTVRNHYWEGGALSDPDQWDFTGQYYHHH